MDAALAAARRADRARSSATAPAASNDNAGHGEHRAIEGTRALAHPADERGNDEPGQVAAHVDECETGRAVPQG